LRIFFLPPHKIFDFMGALNSFQCSGGVNPPCAILRFAANVRRMRRLAFARGRREEDAFFLFIQLEDGHGVAASSASLPSACGEWSVAPLRLLSEPNPLRWASVRVWIRRLLVQLEDGHKRLGGQLNSAQVAHLLLAAP